MYLGKFFDVTVDFPIGFHDGVYYPINFGHSGDLWCYILGVFEPLEKFNGRCVGVIHRDTLEDLLVIAPFDRMFSNSEIEALVEFQERFYKHDLITDFCFNSLIPELTVSSISTSFKFYESIGFKLVYERVSDKFCFMEFEGNQIMLEEDNGNWSTGVLDYPYGRGINISMTVKDVKGLYDKLLNLGFKFFLDLTVNDYLVGDKIFSDKEFIIQDPDGYLLRFND